MTSRILTSTFVLLIAACTPPPAPNQPSDASPDVVSGIPVHIGVPDPTSVNSGTFSQTPPKIGEVYLQANGDDATFGVFDPSRGAPDAFARITASETGSALSIVAMHPNDQYLDGNGQLQINAHLRDLALGEAIQVQIIVLENDPGGPLYTSNFDARLRVTAINVPADDGYGSLKGILSGRLCHKSGPQRLRDISNCIAVTGTIDTDVYFTF